MLKSLFIILIFFGQTIYAMGFSNPPCEVITRPYEPNFVAKHAQAFDVLKAGALSAATFGITRKCMGLKKLNASALTAAAFSGASLYNHFYKKPTLDTLLTNPAKAHRFANNLSKNFYQEIEKNKLNDFTDATLDQAIAQTVALQKKYAEKSPYFMLRECNAMCGLTRSLEPNFRAAYEKEVVQTVLEKSQKCSLVQYVSFASGGMFQDLVSLTKTLSKKPDAVLAIHLIDKNYRLYADSKDFLQETRQVSEKNTIDLRRAQRRENQDKNATKFEQACAEHGIGALQYSAAYDELEYKQFIGYLQKTFPKAQLSLHMHKSTDTYLVYVKQQNIAYADVVVTADIQDESSLAHDSLGDYKKLCLATFKNNPEAQGIMLNKNGAREEAASLLLISADKTCDSVIVQEKDIETSLMGDLRNMLLA